MHLHYALTAIVCRLSKCAAQGEELSCLSGMILEWATSEPSPFHDELNPSKHWSGYLSTGEAYERLHALVECGDLEHDEPFSQEDVGTALLALYEHQQSQLKPLGVLSRQLMGIGRLWRIVPPPLSNVSGPDAPRVGVNVAARLLFALVNSEDATTSAQKRGELLDAFGLSRAGCR